MKKIISQVLIVIIIIGIVGFFNSDDLLKKVYKTEYKEYVEKYANENGVDPLLIYSIIKAESNFEVGATSQKGACGLMQLMDTTAKEVAQNQVMEYESGNTLYNAEKNIKIGIAYFADLKKQFQNDNVALAAYNAGSRNVTSWIKDGIIKADGSDIENIPYKETNTYVRKILKDYKIYKKIYV